MTRTRIIYNPIAGKGGAAALLPEVEAELKQAGIQYDLVVTTAPWHAAELAWEAVKQGVDVVVAAGGDGTANEVLNGLMLAKKAGDGEAVMGILTVGRGNDYAFGMGVPADWHDGVKALADGRRKRLDVGLVTGELYPQGRYFGNGIGVGFDAVVGFVAARSKLTGFMSYLVAAVKTISMYFNAPTVELTLDDETLTQPCLMVSIMNGTRMGGTFHMSPASMGDDGLMDLCIVGEVSRMGIIKLIPRFMAGTQAGHPAVAYKQTRTLTVKAVKGTLPAHADGETLCTEGHELSVELFPQAIQMIVPEDMA